MDTKLLCAVALTASVSAISGRADTIDVSLLKASYTFNFYDASGNSLTESPTITADGRYFIDDNKLSFWTATLTFSLPSRATTASLLITDLAADDRGVVALNGRVIAGAGLYGPGAGEMVFYPDGPSFPYQPVEEVAFHMHGSG